jgi:hypothetical protein
VASIATDEDGSSVVLRPKRGSVGFLLLSMLVLAADAVGAAFVGYAVYTVAAREPEVAYGAAQGVRPIVTLQWPRVVGFLLPVAFLTAVVALGGVATFVHRATFAHGHGQRRVSAPSLLAAQSALFLVIAALVAWGVAGAIVGLQQDGAIAQQGDIANGVLWLPQFAWVPSFAIAIATGFLLSRPSLRPSLRRVSVLAVVACALGGGAAVAQLGATSQGQPLLEAGFYRVSFAGVASVQFMEVTCANGDDCVASGYGTFGSKLPNGRALLATSTDGAATWRVVALPARYSSPSPPACDGDACLVAFGTAASRAPHQVVRASFSPSGAISISFRGSWPLPTDGSPTCAGADCLLAAAAPGGTPKGRSTVPVVWRSGRTGQGWVSARLPVPAGKEAPEGVQGLWCTAGLRCAATVVLTRAGCTFAALSGPCTGRSEMAYTANDGRTWSTGRTDLPVTQVSCDPSGVCTGTTSRPISGYKQQLLVATSDDFGRTWSGLRDAPFGSAITCWTTEHCVAAGERSVLFVTADGGKTWTDQPVFGQLVGGVGGIGAPWCDVEGRCVASAEDGSGHALVVIRGSGAWSAELFPMPSQALSPR